ncbi:beta-class carbonic anhydrase [Streptomyces sp. CA-132043]|uniref:beta-class carbonic anhydrase n=1 Tax=Streptomyces sp. CA-132043 TaxID=3240048 RepID=UPI003D8E7B1B
MSISASQPQSPSDDHAAASGGSVIDHIVEANARYADKFADPELSARPAQKVTVVTCMDARLNLPEALGLEVGDLHTLRNAGGVITDDIIRSLTISQRALGTRSVVVIHHTGCGMQTLTEDFRQELADEVGQRPAWAVESFKDVDVDVRQSVQRLRTSPFLLHTDDIRGFVFDVTTGLLREVDPQG